MQRLTFDDVTVAATADQTIAEIDLKEYKNKVEEIAIHLNNVGANALDDFKCQLVFDTLGAGEDLIAQVSSWASAAGDLLLTSGDNAAALAASGSGAYVIQGRVADRIRFTGSAATGGTTVDLLVIVALEK